MASEANLDFMRRENRRYIVGTPKSLLSRYESALLREDWTSVREGVEVKRLDSGVPGETFILYRSDDRGKKKEAMRERFSKRREEGLRKLAARCENRKCPPEKISESPGRLRERNSRASRFYYAKVHDDAGRACLEWRFEAERAGHASPLDGCYILRSNIPEWKTLERLSSRAGLGDEPRRLLRELANIQLVDVIPPTSAGVELKRSCVTIPTEHQQILLQRLKMRRKHQFVVKTFKKRSLKIN